MRNLKSYITLFVVLAVSLTTIAQDLNWYQNTGLDIINTNTVSGNGKLLSFEVLSQEQTTGYFEITNFKVDGNNLAPFIETKFSSASIFLSQTTTPSLLNNNQYAITIALDGRGGLLGNRYTITVKKPDGTEAGRLDDIILQTEHRIRIEKLSSSQLRFFFNNDILATITDPELSWTRAGIQNYNVSESGNNPGILSVSYAQSGFEITENSYGPFHVTDTDKNWVSVNSYGITENVVGNFIGASVSYYDNLGKGTQSQSFDLKGKKTWASEVRYDRQGRPALSTLTAPIGSEGAFTYKDGFIKKSGNVNFNISDYENADIENPTPVTTEENTLGWYYSENNDTDPYQDVTNRPYSRTIYSELNPGTALKTIGGNKIDNEWKQGYVFSMPAGQELSQSAAFGDTKYNDYKIVKTVARDVHGVESVVFTDTDGRTLAAARSGNEEGGTTSRPSYVTIAEQGFVDIHLPVGTSGISISGNSGISLEVFDLITEQIITTSWGTLPSGFYRVAVSDIDSYTFNENSPITVTYKENYYDYSLNEYDKAGRLLSSKQPLQHLESTFEYNALGQLTYTKSPDEGEAWFKYRRDGQIRYSQNSKQTRRYTNLNYYEQYAYTNYDHLGRPIESGIAYYNTVSDGDKSIYRFENLDPDTPLIPVSNRAEVHITTYDALLQSDKTYLENVHSSYANPSFLSGNVAKTWNENTTTYYSYDIYGRVQWIVQNIVGLGTKTIDYEYDPITSQVNRVLYQKHSTTDLFIHQYTYDKNDYSLTKVETATYGSDYKEHARYEYNETGALKRLDLAEGLQGIDYVYNLNGALKSINSANLTAATDPGGDNNDLFGMNVHYYDEDYKRTGTPKTIPTTPNGIEQYNGNIKSITWNTLGQNNNSPDSYYYSYNKNNWLTGASFNQQVNEADTSVPLDLDPLNQPISSTTNAEARRSITLENGFSITATSSRTFSAKIATDGTVQGDADYNVYDITYDANGNIQKLNRNKDTHQGSNAMDKLSYEYKTDKPNQLLRVDDAAGDVDGADDIGDQVGDENGTNYVYNDIGQLIENKEEKITYLYNASGLVTEIKKADQPLVKFFYNDKNHRVRKESYNPTNGGLTYTDFYIRDAAGTAMAIYRKDANGTNLVENTIYGASRLGVHKSDGSKYYQLTDHLGNVRSVVGRTNTGQAIAMTSATDYYPFGMPMPGRSLSGAEGYRYAYQGQEVDPETGKPAFQLRLWDARIGRWLTTDPAGQYASPYMAMGNNPIIRVDPDGGYDDTVYTYGDQSVEVNDGIDKTIEVNEAQFLEALMWGSIINNQQVTKWWRYGSAWLYESDYQEYSNFYNSVNNYDNFSFSNGFDYVFGGPSIQRRPDIGTPLGGHSIMAEVVSGPAKGLYSIAKYGVKQKGFANHHNVMDAWAKNNIPGYVSRQYSGTTIRLSKVLHTKAHQAERAWMKATFGKVRGNWKNMSAKQMQELSEVMFDAAQVPLGSRRQFYKEFHKYIYSLK
ncbi:RHS repeat-associated core domain-containing protein [uncultured Aquimarina sp.]|uniref:RHS repeat-associated core domain-containing protein n=1 Tax=uncultured Aquimarina sp. TaxID=575652 RepID=UPI00262D7739|nr:RHS repeat-associated core domain-containing protein [uncultured Aquimarina sp.]